MMEKLSSADLEQALVQALEASAAIQTSPYSRSLDGLPLRHATSAIYMPKRTNQPLARGISSLMKPKPDYLGQSQPTSLPTSSRNLYPVWRPSPLPPGAEHLFLPAANPTLAAPTWSHPSSMPTTHLPSYPYAYPPPYGPGYGITPHPAAYPSSAHPLAPISAYPPYSSSGHPSFYTPHAVPAQTPPREGAWFGAPLPTSPSLYPSAPSSANISRNKTTITNGLTPRKSDEGKENASGDEDKNSPPLSHRSASRRQVLRLSETIRREIGRGMKGLVKAQALVQTQPQMEGMHIRDSRRHLRMHSLANASRRKIGGRQGQSNGRKSEGMDKESLSGSGSENLESEQDSAYEVTSPLDANRPEKRDHGNHKPEEPESTRQHGEDGISQEGVGRDNVEGESRGVGKNSFDTMTTTAQVMNQHNSPQDDTLERVALQVKWLEKRRGLERMVWAAETDAMVANRLAEVVSVQRDRMKHLQQYFDQSSFPLPLTSRQLPGTLLSSHPHPQTLNQDGALPTSNVAKSTPLSMTAPLRSSQPTKVSQTTAPSPSPLPSPSSTASHMSSGLNSNETPFHLDTSLLSSPLPELHRPADTTSAPLPLPPFGSPHYPNYSGLSTAEQLHSQHLHFDPSSMAVWEDPFIRTLIPTSTSPLPLPSFTSSFPQPHFPPYPPFTSPPNQPFMPMFAPGSTLLPQSTTIPNPTSIPSSHLSSTSNASTVSQSTDTRDKSTSGTDSDALSPKVIQMIAAAVSAAISATRGGDFTQSTPPNPSEAKGPSSSSLSSSIAMTSQSPPSSSSSPIPSTVAGRSLSASPNQALPRSPDLKLKRRELIASPALSDIATEASGAITIINNLVSDCADLLTNEKDLYRPKFKLIFTLLQRINEAVRTAKMNIPGSTSPSALPSTDTELSSESWSMFKSSCFVEASLLTNPGSLLDQTDEGRQLRRRFGLGLLSWLQEQRLPGSVGAIATERLLSRLLPYPITAEIKDGMHDEPSGGRGSPSNEDWDPPQSKLGVIGLKNRSNGLSSNANGNSSRSNSSEWDALHKAEMEGERAQLKSISDAILAGTSCERTLRILRAIGGVAQAMIASFRTGTPSKAPARTRLKKKAQSKDDDVLLSSTDVLSLKSSTKEPDQPDNTARGAIGSTNRPKSSSSATASGKSRAAVALAIAERRAQMGALKASLVSNDLGVSASVPETTGPLPQDPPIVSSTPSNPHRSSAGTPALSTTPTKQVDDKHSQSLTPPDAQRTKPINRTPPSNTTPAQGLTQHGQLTSQAETPSTSATVSSSSVTSFNNISIPNPPQPLRPPTPATSDPVLGPTPSVDSGKHEQGRHEFNPVDRAHLQSLVGNSLVVPKATKVSPALLAAVAGATFSDFSSNTVPTTIPSPPPMQTAPEHPLPLPSHPPTATTTATATPTIPHSAVPNHTHPTETTKIKHAAMTMPAVRPEGPASGMTSLSASLARLRSQKSSTSSTLPATIKSIGSATVSLPSSRPSTPTLLPIPPSPQPPLVPPSPLPLKPPSTALSMTLNLDRPDLVSRRPPSIVESPVSTVSLPSSAPTVPSLLPSSSSSSSTEKPSLSASSLQPNDSQSSALSSSPPPLSNNIESKESPGTRSIELEVEASATALSTLNIATDANTLRRPPFQLLHALFMSCLRAAGRNASTTALDPAMAAVKLFGSDLFKPDELEDKPGALLSSQPEGRSKRKDFMTRLVTWLGSRLSVLFKDGQSPEVLRKKGIATSHPMKWLNTNDTAAVTSYVTALLAGKECEKTNALLQSLVIAVHCLENATN